ncbi:hypothetical protein C8J57DRAFT_1470086 [Mycena rebaudengoi]|nr:hypothetical protein C8J57DRAFT_1470086 [Mycena rebaudengoi]
MLLRNLTIKVKLQRLQAANAQQRVAPRALQVVKSRRYLRCAPRPVKPERQVLETRGTLQHVACRVPPRARLHVGVDWWLMLCAGTTPAAPRRRSPDTHAGVLREAPTEIFASIRWYSERRGVPGREHHVARVRFVAGKAQLHDAVCKQKGENVLPQLGWKAQEVAMWLGGAFRVVWRMSMRMVGSGARAAAGRWLSGSRRYMKQGKSRRNPKLVLLGVSLGPVLDPVRDLATLPMSIRQNQKTCLDSYGCFSAFPRGQRFIFFVFLWVAWATAVATNHTVDDADLAVRYTTSNLNGLTFISQDGEGFDPKDILDCTLVPSNDPDSSSNGPSSSTGSTTLPATETPASESGPSTCAKRRTPRVPILGGVLGGIFILVLAVIALFWSRTRARKMDREVEPKTIPVAAPRSRPEAMTSPNTLASAQSPPDATEIPPRELAEQGPSERSDPTVAMRGGVRGAVIHTDSGMRLSAARLSSVVDGFPPRTR